MRALIRPMSLSLGLLVSGLLASQAAMAQTAPGAYPAHPGYQQPQQYPAQPGYQQPQQYPAQPGYQQPQQYPAQPGYQQPQPYPDQYQQPQQYPAQPGYQQPQQYPQGYQQPQQYPQGYQQPQQYPQPQPGYYAQPAAAPAYAPPAPVTHRRGFLMLGYLGLNFPVGDGTDGLSTGGRLGGLMGFHAGSLVSLNGELSIDILNSKTPNVSAGVVGFTFSPLFHFGPPQIDIVVGPRLGFYGLYSNSTSTDDTYSETGLAYGLNTGAFFWLGRIAVGGLLSYTAHDPQSACFNDNCDDVDGGSSFKVLTLNGAILF